METEAGVKRHFIGEAELDLSDPFTRMFAAADRLYEERAVLRAQVVSLLKLVQELSVKANAWDDLGVDLPCDRGEKV